jgi:hypothetical protein
MSTKKYAKGSDPRSVHCFVVLHITDPLTQIDPIPAVFIDALYDATDLAQAGNFSSGLAE